MELLGSFGDGVRRASAGLSLTVTQRPVRVPPEFGDGTDRTADLTAWITAQPDGATLDFTGLRVRCDTTLEIASRVGLTVLGGEVYRTITPASRTAAQWRFRECTDLTLDGHTITGPNVNGGISDSAYVATWEAQHSIELSWCRRVLLRDCTVTRPWGDCLYLGAHMVRGDWCEDVTVQGGTWGLTGRQVFALVGARRSTFRGLKTLPARRAVFDAEPHTSATGVDGVLIEDCWFDQQRLNFLTATGVTPVNNVTLRRCNIWSAKINVATTPRSSGWVIEGNTSRAGIGNPAGCGWLAKRVDGLRVVGNHQPLQVGRNMALVCAQDCTGVDVQGNTYPGGVVELRST